MKKIYLCLTAALLLVCSSAHALLIATVGDKAFDSDSYSTPYPNLYALYFALRESGTQNLPAIIQNDFKVEGFTSYPSGTIDLNGHDISGDDVVLRVNGNKINIIGSGSITTIGTNTIAIRVDGTNSNVEDFSVLNVGKDVTIKAPNAYGMGVFGYNYPNKGKECAYGVKVNLYGSIISSSGITINGGVNKTEGNVPVINIGDNAVITGGCEDNAAIYAAGYGIWNIGAATLNAGTPIYAKSGVINIDGATIEACGAKADPQPNNNGFYNTGDAIVMDTNNSYAGAVLLNIYGDATIKSTNGYAIQEVITNGTTSSAAGIAISGDNTVVDGAAGSLQMTENFKDAMKDGSSETYQWVLNGIAGGVYSKVPGVVADGYVAQEVEIGGKKYYQVVVADPEAPAPASQTTYIVNDTEWDYSVEYKNSSALVITTGNTLKVKGVNVNRTSSEDVSKVTVEAGAALVVGSEGMQTNDAKALLLESDAEHGMGMLLYDGSTTATSPYGTAELYVSSKNLSGDERIWQHFGIPTQATPEIEKQVPASFNNWDVKKGWIWDGGSATLNAPWVGHNLSVNSDTPGQIIKFAGQLVGNEDATLALDKYGYNAFANSYTAPVNLKSIIDGAMEIDACTDGAVWMYSAAEALETGVAQFHSYGAATSSELAIDPMQAFFILHESNASDNITVSYEDAVLGYNTRDAVANDYNTATLKITGGGEADEFTIYEGEQFSSSIDKGYDIKQMNHDFIQIYAVQNGENYSSVATDDAENLELTIKTKAATQYTLSFSGISEGYGVKLTDVKSGAEIEVGNDKTYTFTADANTTAVRFRFGKSEVSADEANADAVKIWSANGSLFVEGNAAEADIEIINLSGVKVASAKASGEAVQAVSISNLASGVYVVRVGNTAAKIVK